MAIIKGKTKSGFSFKMDSALFEDAEFLELFAEMHSGDSLAVFGFIKKVLGKEQKEALYEHCRDKKGIVPVTALTDEVVEMLEQLAAANETKN